MHLGDRRSLFPACISTQRSRGQQQEEEQLPWRELHSSASRAGCLLAGSDDRRQRLNKGGAGSSYSGSATAAAAAMAAMVPPQTVRGRRPELCSCREAIAMITADMHGMRLQPSEAHQLHDAFKDSLVDGSASCTLPLPP